MLLGKKLEDITDSEIEQAMASPDIFEQCVAAQKIGEKGGRNAYDLLIKLMRDKEKDVINSAILAAADTKDSRFLFPLANIYNNTSEHQTKNNILNALAELRDPRAIDFLREIYTIETESLKKIIENTIAAQDITSTFKYTFAGTEEQRQKAKNNTDRKLIASPLDFNALLTTKLVRKTREYYGPITYIINTNNELFAGMLIEEHVQAAQGEDVIAAGEILLEYKNHIWAAVELNNRSNGYFPARSTYPIVAAILDKAGIRHPEQFTYLHPRDGFFSDDFLSMFPFHPAYEKQYFGKKRHRPQAAK